MRINGNGNVGIGTNNPGRVLHVLNSASVVARFESTSTNFGGIELKDANTTANFKVQLTAVGDELKVDAGGNERMRIASGGNVGIGTNNPDAKLDVNGKVAIQRPSNYWQNNTQVFFDDGTNLIGSIGHHGGFALALTSNGYRNSSGQWTSHGVNSFTGAAQIEVQPQGNIYFRTDSNKATGTSTNPTNRIHIDSLGRMRIGGITPLYA